MEAMNCPRCGRLFTKIRSPICAACEKADEDTFQLVKQFIDDNPTCTLAQLSDGTKVPIRRITQYVQDGRLEISKGMVGEFRCDKCNKPIIRGRYCESCAVEIGLNVKDMFNKLGTNSEPSKRQRMHTLGKSKSL